MNRCVSFAIALVCALICCVACSRAPEPLVLSGPTMGTQYTVKVVSGPTAPDRAAIQREIDAVLGRIDLEMSTYRTDSALARFNANPSTDWIDVPDDLLSVVSIARRISERSGGAFDVTAAPLINAWGFGASGEPGALPAPAALDALRPFVGYQLLETREHPPALRKRDTRVTVDVNGIAPGYAIDLLASRLETLGLRNFMIDIGGEVLARGVNAKGETWRIAVERPLDTEPTPFTIVELANRSITTSGEYRHYFERDGKRYSHTIDPRTAHPIESSGSVAVVGDSSAEIDAWATALNVLGPEAGLALAERESLPVMYVVVEGEALRARESSMFKREVRR